MLQVKHCTELTMVPSKISEMTLRYEGGFLLRLGLLLIFEDILPGGGDAEPVKRKSDFLFYT